jgi:MFS family permease
VTTTAPPRPSRTLRAGSTAAFVLALAAAVAMMGAASAPSPFYPVLQAEIGFSALASTSIFAVYAFALLVALLVTGSLSDHLGRRPVLSAGFAILAVSMVVFWHAGSVESLLAARVVQGLAAGLLLSALTAAVVDLEPPSRPGSAAVANAVLPLAGMAVGAAASGWVLDVSDSPEPVVFGVLTGLYVVAALAVWGLPETSPGHDGLLRSLRPQVGVPLPARAAFLRSTPAIVAGWATGGLYLSLGAPLIGELGGESHLAQGLVVSVLTGGGALAAFLLRSRTPRTLTLYGTTALAVGTVLTLAALAAHSLGWFVAAVAVAATGFGTAFMGVMRSVTPTVGPAERGELFASVFVFSYVAFGLPAVAAGFAVPHLGLETTAYVYGGAITVLAATAALLRRFGTTE